MLGRKTMNYIYEGVLFFLQMMLSCLDHTMLCGAHRDYCGLHVKRM